MKKLLRRLRGMLGVGITWGTLWGLIGGVVGLTIALLRPVPGLGEEILVWALGMGAYGVVSGMGFAALLSLGEGRKRLQELSLPKVALWGVLGSAAVPLLFGALGFFDAGTSLLDVLGAIGLTATLGGTFATGAVAIARRAELTPAERRELLGDGRS